MTRALRIVVADDEPVMREYFQRMLPRLGYDVVAAAANGRELVELCGEKKPDLIIADVRMPDMDGDVAVQQIFRDAPIPFILIVTTMCLKPSPSGETFRTFDYGWKRR